MNHTENQPGVWSRAWYGWGIFAGVWAIFGILFSIQAVTRPHRAGGRPTPWTEALTLGFADVTGWVLMALVAFAVARRVPIRRDRMIRFIVVYLASMIAAFVLRAAWQVLVSSVAARAQPSLWAAITLGVAMKALMYSLLLGVGYAIVYARQLHERELREAQLETELLSAHLNVLKMQLQPHFLFNTLNSISSGQCRAAARKI